MKYRIQLIGLGLFSLSLAQPLAAANLSLSQFMAEVRLQSPELAAQKAGVEAAKARAEGIRLSAPMIGFMQMKDSMGTNSGYEIAQEIPFPTKAIQDKRVRELEAEAQSEGSSSERAATLAEARRAFVTLWGADSRLKIQKEKHDWLKEHSRVSATLSWSDTSSKIHQLEVESETDMIENELSSLTAEVSEKKADLQIFAPGVNLDKAVLDEPPLASPEIEKGKKPSLLSAKEKELEAKDAQLSLKKQEYLPDLYVRFRSFEGTEIASRSQELMVGVTVPFLFFWQPKAGVSEAAAEKLKAEAELQKTKIQIEARLQSLVKKAESIEVQLKNLNSKLIPRADRRMKLVRNLSQRTMDGLDQHRMVMIAALDLKLKAIDLRIEHENTVSEIFKLTGVNTEEGNK